MPNDSNYMPNNSIKKLDNLTINKIAAGEVVERPCSVIKELVENSIDSGARSITVEITEGGVSLIKITDDGCGIDSTQIKDAFVRHATSKIRSIDDLSLVLSMGFRGEALPSIASVAQVEMSSKTHEAELGTKITIHGGSVIGIEETAMTNGTTVYVMNLFYNIPARKKFLKKPSVESGYITDMIYRIAISRPDISFRYINNGSQIFHTIGNSDLRGAVFSVYGKEVAQKMIEMEYKSNNFKIYGLIGRPELCRANRNYENIFINKRYVKSVIIQQAVEDAYKTRIPIGKFPVYALHIEVPTDTVDVNVHPAKLEVRFHNEDWVYEQVNTGVTSAFDEQVLIPKVQWQAGKVDTILLEESISPPVMYDHLTPPKPPKKTVSYISEPTLTTNSTVKKREGSTLLFNAEYERKPKPIPTVKETQFALDDIAEESSCFFKDYKIVGQLFNTYWIIEQEGTMYLIDQHAAHERILYEEIMVASKSKVNVTQRLLQPMTVSVTEKEKETVEKNLENLREFGFEIEVLGKLSYIITEVPVIFKNPVEQSFFTELIDLLDGRQNFSVDAIHERMAQIACKAAIKANDKQTPTEARELIRRLLRLENPFTCPHGRPTIIEMTKYEIEKKFKRV